MSQSSSSSSDSEEAVARFASVAVNADDISKSAKAAREVSPCIPSQPSPSFSRHPFLTPPFTQANEKRKAAAIRRRAGGGGLLGITPIDVKTDGTTTLLDATQLKIAEALQNQLETQFNTASTTSTSNGDDGSDDNHQHQNIDKDNDDKDEEVSGGVTLFSRKPRMAKKPVFDNLTKSSSKDTGRRRDRRDRKKHYDSSSEDIEERAKRVAVEPDYILQEAKKAARDASMRFEALLKDEKAAEKAKLTIIRRSIAAATTTIATTTASTIAANLY
jgi:hypothetical protein